MTKVGQAGLDADSTESERLTHNRDGQHYPESMRRKFFVNVPAVMGWMFSAMRLFLSKETVRKFTILSYGQYLAGELGHADRLPKEYGGAGNASLRGMAEPWNVTKAEVSA